MFKKTELDSVSSNDEDKHICQTYKTNKKIHNSQTKEACSRCDDAIKQIGDIQSRIPRILVLLARLYRQDNINALIEKDTQEFLLASYYKNDHKWSCVIKYACKSIAQAKSEYDQILQLYEKEKEIFKQNLDMNKDLENLLSDINKILTNVYDDIFPLARTMNRNDEIISAITKLVIELQLLFPWFIEKSRSNDKDSHNGHLTDNQTLADVLCVLKCYIDACVFQYDAMWCSEIMIEKIKRQEIRLRETSNYYIHYLP